MGKRVGYCFFLLQKSTLALVEHALPECPFRLRLFLCNQDLDLIPLPVCLFQITALPISGMQ